MTSKRTSANYNEKPEKASDVVIHTKVKEKRHHSGIRGALWNLIDDQYTGGMRWYGRKATTQRPTVSISGLDRVDSTENMPTIF